LAVEEIFHLISRLEAEFLYLTKQLVLPLQKLGSWMDIVRVMFSCKTI